jgi:hypothetical protein
VFFPWLPPRARPPRARELLQVIPLPSRQDQAIISEN